MAERHVAAERRIDAPAERVYRLLADYTTHHPRILPPAFSEFRVEQGGVGAGTVHSFRLTAGGRTRAYRMRVDEPEPGRVLTETDQLSSTVTTFTVLPEGRAAGYGSGPAGRARAVSAGSSRDCSRRACSAGSTRTSSSRWIATPAPAHDSLVSVLLACR